jgi:hypothetical protein
MSAQTKNPIGPRPFSNLTGKESKFIKKLISKIEVPILEIYDQGVLNKCSHYKHFARLVEMATLAEPGKKIEVNFDEQKIKKAVEGYLSNRIPGDVKLLVSGQRSQLQAALRKLAVEETDLHERFVLVFVSELVLHFMESPSTFHAVKQTLLQVYNDAIVSDVVELQMA